MEITYKQSLDLSRTFKFAAYLLFLVIDWQLAIAVAFLHMAIALETKQQATVTTLKVVTRIVEMAQGAREEKEES